MRRFSIVLMFLAAFPVFAGSVAAQGDDMRAVTSPFAEELDFKIGRTLDLNLLVEGVKWTTLRADAGDEADWRDGKNVKVVFTNQLENLTDRPRTVSVIVLLEDSRGRQLERIELKVVKIGAGKYDEDRQKIKVDGGLLVETAKIYLFAEVN